MSLRQQALKGGSYLAFREGVGIVVRSLGLIVLVRLIGPASYGLYAGPLAVMLFLAVIAISGVDVFLIRRGGELEDRWLDLGFTYLLGTGLVAAAIGAVASPLYGSLVHSPRAVAPFLVLSLTIPVNILWIPGKVKLERSFRYRQLAAIEIGADVAQTAVGIAVAVAGGGVWAAVAGFTARQVALLVGASATSGYVPRLHWDRARAKEMLRFGAPLSSMGIVGKATDMVIPVVVGRYMDVSAVGIASLTLRLADTLSFVQRATYRIAIVALGRMQTDAARMRKAVHDAMALQALGVGPPLVAFSVLGTVVVPVFLGHKWVEVSKLFPYIALNYLLIAMFTMQVAALVVRGRNMAVLAQITGNFVLTYLGAIVLVPHLGLRGLGIAEVVSVGAQALNHRSLSREIGSPGYDGVLPWIVLFGPLLFLPLVPPAAIVLCFVPGVLVLSRRATRAQLRTQVVELRRTVTRRSAATPPPDTSKPDAADSVVSTGSST